MSDIPELVTVCNGLCRLPTGSEQVFDADEEVFILYSQLLAQSSGISDTEAGFRGLGHVSSHKDLLSIKFELTNQTSTSGASSVKHESPSRASGRSRKGRKTQHEEKAQVLEKEIQIAQDKTALRSRKGDTGSVVWKASVDFAQMMLQHAHFPSTSTPFLFDFDKLKQAHLLELGAGTGILGVALSPLVRQYTVTDIEDLVPLIQKNVVLNFPQWPDASNIDLTALDWIQLQKTPSHTRSRYFQFETIDLLLIVDCIYHPSLLPPLVETIDYLATPNLTTVLVMVELRAEDVVREFLERWLNMGGWEIWRVKGGDGVVDRPYALWMGWKREG